MYICKNLTMKGFKQVWEFNNYTKIGLYEGWIAVFDNPIKYPDMVDKVKEVKLDLEKLKKVEKHESDSM